MTLSRALASVLLIAGVTSIGGCQSLRNFTTYYNLFYNMERIMDEAEEELLYIREQKSPEPTFHIAHDDALLKGSLSYNHLKRLSMTMDEMRANKIKLDSIVIKGSKLLARAPNSDFIDDAVFYISKSYFYQNEWFQSQKKANELIENFPDSKWLPDAHLVLAMDQLHLGKPDQALTTLSRSIDVAWAHKRSDVLINAFRLNADIHLASGNVDEAIRPFERAVTLSDNVEDRARWHYEIGVVLFRTGQFERALAAFDATLAQSPDVFTQFQTALQRAVTLRALGRADEAARQLADLRDNGNFEPWWGLVEVERLNLAAQGGVQITDSAYAAVDSMYPGKTFAAYGSYERGINAFRGGNYDEALGYFSKVQSAPTPFQRKAQHFAMLLGQYYEHHARAQAFQNYPLTPFPDSVRSGLADSYYNLARLFTTFQRADSSATYYDLSEKYAPFGSVAAARVLFARAHIARGAGRDRDADSLLEILVESYGMTEYGRDARRQLGYTEYAKRDTAEDTYLSGTAFMRTGDHANALAQFHRVMHRYPETEFGVKAYYATGLIHEQHTRNFDSAFWYYSEILNRFPLSEQAEVVRPIIDAYLNRKIGGVGGSQFEVPRAPVASEPSATAPVEAVPSFGTEVMPLDDTPSRAPNASAPDAKVEPNTSGTEVELDPRVRDPKKKLPPP